MYFWALKPKRVQGVDVKRKAINVKGKKKNTWNLENRRNQRNNTNQVKACCFIRSYFYYILICYGYFQTEINPHYIIEDGREIMEVLKLGF